MAYKGKFKPKNRTKYKGDPDKIIYRSLWELRFMRYLDSTPSILKWSSEEVVVPYRSPIDGRRHRYFPHFWIRVKTSDGSVKESLIEIKPKAQTSLESAGRSQGKKKQAVINMAKWEAANAYAKQNKIRFRVISEEQLFHNGKRK